jgi:hypothetical protein
MCRLLQVSKLDAEEAIQVASPYFSVIPDFASLCESLTNAPTERPDELKTNGINGRFFDSNMHC